MKDIRSNVSDVLTGWSIKFLGQLFVWASVVLVVFAAYNHITGHNPNMPSYRPEIQTQQIRYHLPQSQIQALPSAPVASPPMKKRVEVIESKKEEPKNTHPIIETTLFDFDVNDFRDKDGMPQEKGWNKKDLEWASNPKFKKEKILKWAEKNNRLFSVIKSKISTPNSQRWMAAVAYVESDGVEDKKGDGNRSWGTWQIHDKYHPEVIKFMGNNWDDYATNLEGFLKVIDKQSQWRQGRDDFRGISSYYNA